MTVVCLTVTSVTPARVKKFITHSSQLIYLAQYLMHEYLLNEQEKQQTDSDPLHLMHNNSTKRLRIFLNQFPTQITY